MKMVILMPPPSPKEKGKKQINTLLFVKFLKKIKYFYVTCHSVLGFILLFCKLQFLINYLQFLKYRKEK